MYDMVVMVGRRSFQMQAATTLAAQSPTFNLVKGTITLLDDDN